MRVPMSSKGKAAVAMAALTLALIAGAADEIEIRDEDMLEFLGSWEAGDEDWLAMNMEDLEVRREQVESGDENGAEAEDEER